MPRIKLIPGDFVVEEVSLYAPTGEGDFTLVQVCKENVDTEEVVSRWSRRLGIEASQIGFAGRKDRRSISRQWLSVPGWIPDLADRVAADRERDPSIEVLEVARSRHRLRPGDLAGNRFRILIREIDPAAEGVAVARLECLRTNGLVNRFGRQRFGAAGGNAAGGRRVLEGTAARAPARQQRFLISALQAELFNHFLDRRPVPHHTLLDGDLALNHINGRLRIVDDATTDQPLADRLELSPTGPIYGAKMRTPKGLPGELERLLWSDQELPEWSRSRVPRRLVPAGGRRPLRVPVQELTSRRCESGLEIAFFLPAGSYATVLVESLFDEPLLEGPSEC